MKRNVGIGAALAGLGTLGLTSSHAWGGVCHRWRESKKWKREFSPRIINGHQRSLMVLVVFIWNVERGNESGLRVSGLDAKRALYHEHPFAVRRVTQI
jgi:hypothetical protein